MLSTSESILMAEMMSANLLLLVFVAVIHAAITARESVSTDGQVSTASFHLGECRVPENSSNIPYNLKVNFTKEEIEQKRQEKPINRFTFGRQVVTTKVHLMVGNTAPDEMEFDVASFCA